MRDSKRQRERERAIVQDGGGGGGVSGVMWWQEGENEKRGKSIEKLGRDKRRGSWRRDKEHQWGCSSCTYCIVLKASDTCHNNAINLMHDVIYLMPHVYTFIHMKNACASLSRSR